MALYPTENQFTYTKTSPTIGDLEEICQLYSAVIGKDMPTMDYFDSFFLKDFQNNKGPFLQ